MNSILINLIKTNTSYIIRHRQLSVTLLNKDIQISVTLLTNRKETFTLVHKTQTIVTLLKRHAQISVTILNKNREVLII